MARPRGSQGFESDGTEEQEARTRASNSRDETCSGAARSSVMTPFETPLRGQEPRGGGVLDELMTVVCEGTPQEVIYDDVTSRC